MVEENEFAEFFCCKNLTVLSMSLRHYAKKSCSLNS